MTVSHRPPRPAAGCNPASSVSSHPWSRFRQSRYRTSTRLSRASPNHASPMPSPASSTHPNQRPTRRSSVSSGRTTPPPTTSPSFVATRSTLGRPFARNLSAPCRPAPNFGRPNFSPRFSQRIRSGLASRSASPRAPNSPSARSRRRIASPTSAPTSPVATTNRPEATRQS